MGSCIRAHSCGDCLDEMDSVCDMLSPESAHSKQPVSMGGTEEVQGAEEMVGLMREEEREVGHRGLQQEAMVVPKERGRKYKGLTGVG